MNGGQLMDQASTSSTSGMGSISGMGSTGETYFVPVDPMDELQCDSCQ